MRILVTGGTGFLGGRLITKLAADGQEVFALTRSASSQDRLRGMGASPVAGDLESDAPLSLPKVDAVVHAAAQFRFAGPRAPYFRTNVDGTARLLDAAKTAGATTFVYISAAGIVMDDRGSAVRDADETAPTYPNSFSAYLASKAQGEAAVLAADGPGFRTVALRPPAIWGPGDMFSRELPQAIAAGRFAFVDGGEFLISTCHVDNVIEAVERALDRGAGGRAYFVNDQDRPSFRDFVRMIAGVQGVSVDRVRALPYGLAFTMGRLMESVWSLAGRKDDPPLSRSMVRMIGREFTTNDAAARHELGYAGATSRAEGVRRYTATLTGAP